MCLVLAICQRLWLGLAIFQCLWLAIFRRLQLVMPAILQVLFLVGFGQLAAPVFLLAFLLAFPLAAIFLCLQLMMYVTLRGLFLVGFLLAAANLLFVHTVALWVFLLVAALQVLLLKALVGPGLAVTQVEGQVPQSQDSQQTCERVYPCILAASSSHSKTLHRCNEISPRLAGGPIVLLADC
jgi:hypothetical protein